MVSDPPQTQQLPTHADYSPPPNPDVNAVANAFQQSLSSAVEKGDGKGFASLFIPSGYWRDVLAFTKDYRTFEVPSIAAAASVSGERRRRLRITD